MKKATIMLLAAAMLPALGQAQTVNICDRTPQVRDAIMQAVGANDCATVNSALLVGLRSLDLEQTQLTTLNSGDFDGLPSLRRLDLSRNQLATLPAGVFNGLTNLQGLYLSGNQLTDLPDGLFDDLIDLRDLHLSRNDFTTLPDGVFDGLARLGILELTGNKLTAFPAGVFDGLTNLRGLYLSHNDLTALPDGAFDGLASLQVLALGHNRLSGLRRDDPLFAGLPDGVDLGLEGQRLNICGRTPQVRDAIMRAVGANDCTAVSLSGLQELRMHRGQLTSLREGDFHGLTGLHTLGLDRNQLSTLPAGVFDGLTSLRRLYLDRNQLSTLPAGVFDGLSRLRDLNLRGNRLTALPAGVFDSLISLERLYLHSNRKRFEPEDPVFAGLPDSVVLYLDGYEGPPLPPEAPERPAADLAAVPLLVSASDSMRQGFVRIINESNESGTVRVLAFDDAGTAATPVEIQLGANRAFHFNAGDLENGNANKGINAGIGSPVQGHWRLDVETALDVRVLAFVRTGDGFLTAMHDVLQRDAQGRLTAWTFNPASNTDRVSRLRLVNTGATAESVSIEGVDDRGNAAGPVTLTLASDASRTLSALDLEEGAQGLNGSLGDGAGKWRLFITAGQSVVGVSLLESASGHLTNLSTMGAP